MATKPKYHSRFSDDTGTITKESRQKELDKMKAAGLKPDPVKPPTKIPGAVDYPGPSNSNAGKTVTLQSTNTGDFPVEKNIGGAVFSRNDKNDEGKYTYSAGVNFGGKDYQVSEELAQQFNGNLVKAAKSMQDENKTEFEKVVDEAGGPTKEELLADEEEVRTTEEEAWGKVWYKDYEDLIATGKELGLDTSWMPTSQKEFMEMREDEKREAMRYLEKMQQYQAGAERGVIRDFEKQSEGAKAATIAGLAQGREGVVSATSATLGKEFAQEMESRRKELVRTYDNHEMQRQQAMTALKKAQQGDDAEQIDRYQARLDAAEREIENDKIRMLEAAKMQTELALNVMETTGAEMRANMTSFTGMVDQGMTFEPSQIVGLAETLRIPASVAMNYYNAAETIRNDKSMDQQTKTLELADLKYDFTNKINGIRSEEAMKVNDFMTLSKSGNYTPSQLTTLATAMEIPNELNPMYQADLKLSQAKANIELKKANGQPVSQSDWATYYENQAIRDELYGTGGEAYVPNKPLEGLSVEYVGGALVISQEGGFKDYQCGEFVNRVWGLSSGGSGGFGDTQADKNGKVTTKAKDVNINNYQQMLKPGMAFITNNNHVGLITQIGDNGEIMTMEANIGDGNPNISDPPMPNSRNIKDMDLVGYANPPNATIVEGAKTVKTDLDLRVVNASAGESTQTRKSNQEAYDTALKTGDSEIIENTVAEIERKKYIPRAERIYDDYAKGIEDYTATKTKTSQMDSLYQAFLDDPSGSKTFLDQGLITVYNKILDPTSVVRESEYNRTPENLSLVNRMQGTYDQLLSGGAGLTGEDRKAAVDAAHLLMDGAERSYNETIDNAVRRADTAGIPEGWIKGYLGLEAVEEDYEVPGFSNLNYPTPEE